MNYIVAFFFVQSWQEMMKPASAECTLDQDLHFFLQILELCKHYLTLDVSIWSTVTFGC